MRHVECAQHGLQEMAFVCHHLAASLESGDRVGFFYSPTSGPRSDAWCSACEQVRLREGGPSGNWNDVSMAFADIKLICGICYDAIRERQGFESGDDV